MPNEWPIRVLELRSVRGTGGGPEKTILQGAIQSDPRRFDVTVCYLRDRRDPIFGIEKRAQKLGVRYVEILERHSFDWRIWPQLRRLIRQGRIQIVHSHDYKSNLLALMLRPSEGIIPLSTVHGWTGHSTRERWLYYPADKRVLSHFPHMIAVSREIRDELVRTGAVSDRVTVLLNGIDPALFRRSPELALEVRSSIGVQLGDIVIGAVGRLEPQKRFDLLIAAFDQLRRSLPILRLIIAGEGSSRAELEAAIERRNLQGLCRLLGHTDDVGRLHHAFDIFVQSSTYEGTPNAVLEAMAMKTPLVATDVGGTADLARDNVDGLIVRPGDVGALVAAVSRLLRETDQTQQRVESARARVEGPLSFAARQAALESIYCRLMNFPWPLD